MLSDSSDKNPFLEMGFIKFGAIVALFMGFLPWSVLVCLAVLGGCRTKFLVAAIVRDWVTTMLAIVVGVGVALGAAVYFVVSYFG